MRFYACAREGLCDVGAAGARELNSGYRRRVQPPRVCQSAAGGPSIIATVRRACS